jgi:hypothetical protein
MRKPVAFRSPCAYGRVRLQLIPPSVRDERNANRQAARHPTGLATLWMWYACNACLRVL